MLEQVSYLTSKNPPAELEMCLPDSDDASFTGRGNIIRLAHLFQNYVHMHIYKHFLR